MYSSIQRRLFFVGSLLLICISMAACGGTSTPPTSTGSTATAIPVTTLKVCQISKSINFFAFYVAQQQGYFTAQHLSIADPSLLQVGSKVAVAVAAGSCDVGNGVITDAFGWQKTDPNARVIDSLVNGYAIDIVVSKSLEQQANISASSTLAEKVNALKGKKIGITGPNSGTQALLTYLFKQEGLNASTDATQVSLGSDNTAALAALKTGRVDALSYAAPFGEDAVAAGVGDILVSPVRGDIPSMVGEVQAVTYASQKTITEKPQAIEDYIRAIGQAEAYIASNPTQAKALLNTYLGLGQTVTDAVYAAVSGSFAKDPQISEATYNIAAQFHLSAGLIAKIPAYADFIAASTITSALS